MRSNNRRRFPGWLTFVVAWLGLSLIAVAWSLATPISASPDEPAHVIKAASVVRGQFIGSPTDFGLKVQVPNYIGFTHAQTCYAFNPDVTADCSEPVPGDPWKIVDSSTTAGLYNPVYYLLVGWPSLIFQDSAGIFAMRIVSGVLCSLFLALSFALISRWPRRLMPMIGFAAATTPMVFFLNGSVNPNSLEITATLAAFVGVLSVVLHPRPNLLWGRSMVVLAGAAIAVNTRGLSPVWVAIALLVPFILSDREQIRGLLKSTAIRTAVIGIGISTAFALLWLLSSNSLIGPLPIDEDAAPPHLAASPLAGFLITLELTFSHAQNMVGIFGWLDVAAPAGVFFLWSVLAGGLLVVALVLLRGRRLLVVTALLATVLFLPPLFQAAYITTGGFIWQGRYTLPAFVCLMVVLGALLAEYGDRLASYAQKRLVILITCAWAIAQVYSFATVLRRYSVGISGGWVSMLREPAWTPPGGIIPTLLIFTVLVAGFSVWAVNTLRARTSTPVVEQSLRLRS